MYIVMGATGHVGGAVARALLERGQSVTVVIRDRNKAGTWERQGAGIAIADVDDPATLRAAFRRGRRAFILNPPAAPSTDTDEVERRSAASIVAALHGAGLEKIVLESTYGAQPGERLGDLSVLYELEQAVTSADAPATVLRAAYYMSNWDAVFDAARSGVLPTMFPADLRIPMVAATDIARTAADLLMSASAQSEVCHVEGPAHYCASDVAVAFAETLATPVQVATTPRAQWQQAFGKLGFSPAAAESYARMTAAVVDGRLEAPRHPHLGTVTISQYIATLAAARIPPRASATPDPR
jgi:uncharacterized protein YbjT (DUF2867 family)